VVSPLSSLTSLRFSQVATTDEKPDSPFVRELKEDLGWKVLDHDAMRTTEQYGNWYPAMVDAAILARGAGFVGAFIVFSFFPRLNSLGFLPSFHTDSRLIEQVRRGPRSLKCVLLALLLIEVLY
jgi:hypothetical protein